MLSQIQRFGGAMFTPVLLFPFAGMVVGIAIMLKNPMFVGETLANPQGLFFQIVHIIEEGGWTVFRNMPLIFAIGLPIGAGAHAGKVGARPGFAHPDAEQRLAARDPGQIELPLCLGAERVDQWPALAIGYPVTRHRGPGGATHPAADSLRPGLPPAVLGA